MIGRQTAYVLARIYAAAFSVTVAGRQYMLNRGGLRDFLYVWEFDERTVDALCANASARQLADAIMAQLTSAAMNWLKYAKPSVRRKTGHQLLLDLSRAVLARNARNVVPAFKDTDDLARRLELDGYTVRSDGLVVHEEADVLDVAEAKGALVQLLTDLGLKSPVIDEPLRLSEEHYVAGRWSDSIANSRKARPP